MTTRKWPSDPEWLVSLPLSGEHEWCDNGSFCLKCGATLTQYTERERPTCDQVGNTIGISHILYERVKARVVG